MNPIALSLIHLGDSFGGATSESIRNTLQYGEPRGGGIEEAKRFLGPAFDDVIGYCAPLIRALDEMIPGFSQWLNTSGYGDDKYMIASLFALANRLEGMPTVKRSWESVLERARATPHHLNPNPSVH